MNFPDLINGSFELLGGILSWANVYKLWKDREVKGTYWPMTFFWMSWGIWNLFYYPQLDQWLSFIGCCVLELSSLVWTIMIVYFSVKKEKR